MRRTLIEFLKPPLTERAPALDDTEILALGAEVSRATIGEPRAQPRHPPRRRRLVQRL